MTALLLSFALLFAPGISEDCIFEIADDDSLAVAMDSFHDVMGELFHGPVAEGNMEPVFGMVDTLKERRDAVLAANLPTEFEEKCSEISTLATTFSSAVDAVAAAAEGKDADAAKAAFDDMHDAYRELRMMTTSPMAYVEKFHDVMQPLWHESWLEEDTEAIAKGVAAMEHYARLIHASYSGNGAKEAPAKALLDAVLVLKASCETGEKETILADMEKLHEAFHALEDHEDHE